MPPPSMQYRFILVSDLDWTMVDHSDKTHASLLQFNALWQSRFASDSLLVFSTGRSRHLYEELRKEAPLLVPDVLVCSVGTEVYWRSEQECDAKWSGILDAGWDNSKVREVASTIPELVPQEGSEQRPHKVSYHLQLPEQGAGAQEAAAGVLSQLEEGLEGAGLRCKVVYSGGVDVDVLPHCASKGEALKYLLRQLPAPTAGVQVNGDSGNDIELLAVDGVAGCCVENAHPELLQWVDANSSTKRLFKATKRCAGGIIEGLQHFGFMQN